VFHISIWWAWSFVWGGLSPPNPPRGDGTGWITGLWKGEQNNFV